MKTTRMKKSIPLLVLLILSIIQLSIPNAFAQPQTRTEIIIPDIPGYKTLKCDFHMHSVFSDGTVWPTIRVEEAWLEGLDGIAFTEHVEYHPHKKDIPIRDLNRSYNIAKARADELGIILIKGAEITRSNPPGHFNAIFLKDVNALDTKDWRDAFRAALQQGAFLFWNHPGYRQPDDIPVWYDEHTEIFEKGLARGMEVVNSDTYYPLALQWCLEKNITMLSNSDLHPPVNMLYDLSSGDHRSMTLVFATEKSEQGIKEALFAGRTVAFYENQLIGREEYLQPIFIQSIKIINPEVKMHGKNKALVQIYNGSDIGYELEAAGELAEVSFPEKDLMLKSLSKVGILCYFSPKKEIWHGNNTNDF